MTATLEYNAWALSVCYKYRVCVCSSLAFNQNNQFPDAVSRACIDVLPKGKFSVIKVQDDAC